MKNVNVINGETLYEFQRNGWKVEVVVDKKTGDRLVYMNKVRRDGKECRLLYGKLA